MTRPLVLLNPGCNYATGRSRWARVEPGLRARLGEFDVEELQSESEVKAQVSSALSRGVVWLAAAGGDGTVNLVANAMLELGAKDAVLGGIGLGSSNDFHKPFRPEDFIARMPVRVDFAHARPVDVIRVEYADGAGGPPTANSESGLRRSDFVIRTSATKSLRCCLLNASIGITAEGNAFFNRRTAFIRALQRISHDLAVTGAALRSLVAFKDIPARLAIDGAAAELAVTNLGILKRPNFAGSLRYDTEIAVDDGRLGVNASCGLNLFERMSTFAALSRGRFQGRPKTLCRYGTSVEVAAERRFAVELDGEIVYARTVRFLVMPKVLRVCL
jgi:diacylglycerol kinase family enzyme